MSVDAHFPEPTEDIKSANAEIKDESIDKLSVAEFRAETPSDFETVEDLINDAFGVDKNIGEMVRLIRESPNYVPEYSVVAEKAGKVVGHVMLSYLNLEDGVRTHRVLTLSPLSVLPSEQRNGIGGRLIDAVVSVADQAGEQLVVLEGSPKYYPRFGFRPASEVGVSIDLPDWAPPEAAMALPLTSYDASIKGRVKYPPAFDVAHD